MVFMFAIDKITIFRTLENINMVDNSLSKNTETLGIRLLIISIILFILGIVAFHPQTVLETEIDETIFLASLFFFIVGVITIIKGRRKHK